MPRSLVKKPRVELTPQRVKKFLREMEKTGNLKASSAYIGVVPQTIYKAMDRDPHFKDAVEAARNKASRDIENELRRRAIDGVEEDIFHQGVVVGTKKTYSDRLLELLAKGNIDKYGKLQDNFGVQVNIGADSIKNKLAGMLNIEIEKEEKEVIEGDYKDL